ncbi:hypothetical protein F4806DRAFT_324535 [Annulohypoxylon nitens]|nr:hypothetical protein F4806DRAFT_324535 [Annulohypoxylon nitens]
MSLFDYNNFVSLLYITSFTVIIYLWILRKVSSTVPCPRPRAQYGLRYLTSVSSVSQDTSTQSVAIIFIHGLGADPTKTWLHGNTCWITDFLPEDIEKEKLDVSTKLLTFDYNSFWARDANAATLRTTATSLGQELKYGEIQHDDLILIGHSYGGLVIKKACSNFLITVH